MDEEESEQVSGNASQFATALGCSVVASSLAALPAVLRVRPAFHESQAGFSLWITLAAITLIPALALIVGFRSVRADLKHLRSQPEVLLGTAGLGLGLFTSMNVLLGAALRKATHHAGLAGATYAVLSLFGLVGAVLAALRLHAFACQRGPAALRALSIVGMVLLGTTVAFAFVKLGRGVGTSVSTGVSAALLDCVLLVGAAFLLSQRALIHARVLKLVGPPLAVVALAICAMSVRTQPLQSGAPVHSFLRDLIL
jgi:hypothetical protein